MPRLIEPAQQERLLDLACARLREGSTSHLAMAAGEAGNGLVPVAIAIRDSSGAIDLEVWEVPAAGWNPTRFADELENGSMS
jgi:hypothetical protein